MKNIVIFAIFCLIFASKNANSQIVDSMHYDWTVFEYTNEKDERKCYIASLPQNTQTSHTGRRNPYISITVYEETGIEEISVYGGFEYKINSHIYMLIGKNQLKMFTSGEYAWFKRKIEDKNAIQMMLNSSNIKIRSDSSIGTYAIDEYSSKGLPRAYLRMKQLCQ